MKLKIIKQSDVNQIFKFGIVGFLNTSIDFTIFSLLHLIGVNYFVCQLIGYSSGTANSYLFNKFWTFKRGISHKEKKEILQFVIVNLVSLSVTEIGLMFLIDYENLNIYMSKVCVIFLAQGINYFCYKFWVFIK